MPTPSSAAATKPPTNQRRVKSASAPPAREAAWQWRGVHITCSAPPERDFREPHTTEHAERGTAQRRSAPRRQGRRKSARQADAVSAVRQVAADGAGGVGSLPEATEGEGLNMWRILAGSLIVLAWIGNSIRERAKPTTQQSGGEVLGAFAATSHCSWEGCSDCVRHSIASPTLPGLKLLQQTRSGMF
jgi:hypothetical protein